jgi:hypothetical protein
MKRILAAAFALFAVAAFAGSASADCTPGHSAQKEDPARPTGT